MYWKNFLKLSKLLSNTKYYDCFHFETNRKWENILLDMLLKGQKKATTITLESFKIEKTPLPKAGDYSIVTNWNGDPKCIFLTTKVTILPFNEITFTFANVK